MTIDRFEELLSQLGTELDVPLHLDKQGACKLRINDSLDVQLEPDRSQEKLLLASFISEIPPGKLRENVLKDALKANGPLPLHGIFSYSERNNQLTLFAFLPFSQLTGKILADFLALFVEKATSWQQGIERGQTASLISQQTKMSDLWKH